MIPDGAGGVYVADYGSSAVRQILPNGTIASTNFAGTNGLCAAQGDGGPASLSALCSPVSIALDGLGGMYIADFGSRNIRRVLPNKVRKIAGRKRNSSIMGSQQKAL